MTIKINSEQLEPDDVFSKIVILVSIGLNNSEIINHFIENDPQNGLDGIKIKELIGKAKKHIKSSINIDFDYECGNSLTRLNDLYKKSANIQDYKTCLATQKQIISLVNEIKNQKETDFKL